MSSLSQDNSKGITREFHIVSGIIPMDSIDCWDSMMNDSIVILSGEVFTPVSGMNISSPEVMLLNETHAADLARSGIDVNTAVMNGIYSASAEEVMRITHRNKSVGSGMVIPYLSADGSPIIGKNGERFQRVKLDNPELAIDEKGKGAKYLTASGAGQNPYILPSVSKQLQEHAIANVIITEGEKKALCAVKNGLPAIGLPGNFGWTEDGKFHSILNALLYPGLEVIIVWDSDAALNEGFALSTQRLGDALRTKGCVVKVVILDQLDEHKTGLDDYLVHKDGGVEGFRSLAKDIKPVLKKLTFDQYCKHTMHAFDKVITQLPQEQLSSFLSKVLRKGFMKNAGKSMKKKLQLHWSGLVPQAFDMQKIFEDAAVEENPVTLMKLSEENKTADAKTIADKLISERFSVNGTMSLRYYRGVFYNLKGAHWDELPINDIDSIVMGGLRNNGFRSTKSMQANVIENLRAEGVGYIPSNLKTPIRVNGMEYKHLENTIVVANGMLLVDKMLRGESDFFIPPDKSVFDLNALPVEYDPNAKCPQFDKFLSEVIPDEEMRRTIQQMIGLILIAEQKYEVFFILIGNGGNGKSVLLHIITELLGARNVCAVPLSEFNDRFGTYPLITKLVSIVTEMPTSGTGTKRSIAEDKLKAIVSGDLMKFERKNQDPIEARAIARLIFAMNEMPYFMDRSDGIARRAVYIPFNVKITSEQRDLDLKSSIASQELPGVLNFALEGLIQLTKAKSFITSKAGEALKLQHRIECAPELEFFDHHCLSGGPDDFVPIQGLYSEYRQFCADNGYPFVINKNQFSAAIRRKFQDSFECTRNAPPASDFPGIIAGKRYRGYSRLQFFKDGIPDE